MRSLPRSDIYIYIYANITRALLPCQLLVACEGLPVHSMVEYISPGVSFHATVQGVGAVRLESRKSRI
jgi:hypothetical protein